MNDYDMSYSETNEPWQPEPAPEPLDYKPPVRLLGEDGNAFNIIAKCSLAAKQAVKAGHWPKGHWEEIRESMTAGDYNRLLMTVMEHFDVS